MSQTPKRLGMKLKKIREAKGMSQAAVAKKARISREYVNKLEAGRYDPTVGVLRRLAKALEVSMDDLMIDPQEKLRRLKTAEVLREAALGGRTRTWFDGALPDYPDPYIADATKALAGVGFIAETKYGRTYRATERGRKFLRQNGLDDPGWIIRAATIEFPLEK